MTNDIRNDDESQWDQAVSDRLAKLRTMPVETTRLGRALRAQIPSPANQEPTGRLRIFTRPMRAVAAGIAILLIAGVVLMSTSGGPVMASPTEMARMHEDLVSGRVPVTHVDTIEEANRVLLAQWPASPGIPDAPQAHVMVCCMKSVKNKQVACVLLKGEDAPITMAVANAADVKVPASSNTVTRSGVEYHVQSSGAINMVSTQRNGRLVCLIGQVSAERLMDLATKLAF
jgi:hypothetical protein